jgi:hypothetical protein
MMIRKVLTALAVTILVAAGMAATAQPVSAQLAAAQSVKAQPGAPGGCYPVYWKFVGRYNQDPSAYGCASGWEFSRDGGMVQDFTNGQMVWSPRQGNEMIISAYHRTYWTDTGLQHGISLIWNTSHPYNYDTWLIRNDYNGNFAGQAECVANTWLSFCGRESGSRGWNNVKPGLYRFIIEGCDYHGWSHTCTQGWTNPLWIWF